MVESWTKNLLSTVLVSSVINIKDDGAMKVRISRTVLNGGEWKQESSSDKGEEGSKSEPT